MPKTDLVPCFNPGSAQTSIPDFTEIREKVRQWKKAGTGYFVCNGKAFQLVGPPPIPEIAWDELLRRFDVRGASVKIDEPTDKRIGMVSRFVMGESYAVAAVTAWA